MPRAVALCALVCMAGVLAASNKLERPPLQLVEVESNTQRFGTRHGRHLYGRKGFHAARFRSLQSEGRLRGHGQFPGAGLLKKVGGAIAGAAKAAVGAVAGMAAMLTRSTALTMTNPRKCCMCSYVIQMADKKLTENPYTAWQGFPDTKPFAQPDQLMKAPQVVKQGTPGAPSGMPSPPPDPGSGAAPEMLGSGDMLAPVDPSSTDGVKKGEGGEAPAEFVEVAEELTTEFYRRPPTVAPVPGFNPFPAFVQEGAHGVGDVVPPMAYDAPPLAPGMAMNAAPGMYLGGAAGVAPGAAGYEFGDGALQAAPTPLRLRKRRHAPPAMRFTSARQGAPGDQHSAYGGAVPGGWGSNPAAGGGMPSAYSAAARSHGAMPDVGPPGMGGPMGAMPGVGPGGMGAMGPPAGHSAYSGHAHPVPEVVDVLEESEADLKAKQAAAGPHAKPAGLSALDSVLQLRHKLLHQVEEDVVGTPAEAVGMQHTPGGAARFSSQHAAAQYAAARPTIGSQLSYAVASLFGRRAQANNRATVQNEQPLLPPKEPSFKGKQGPREKFRTTYRVEYMVKWQKLYQEFMGAMDDTCKTTVPSDMRSACRPMFAKAETIVDMMLHGYDTGDVCIRLQQCKPKFFGM